MLQQDEEWQGGKLASLNRLIPGCFSSDFDARRLQGYSCTLQTRVSKGRHLNMIALAFLFAVLGFISDHGAHIAIGTDAPTAPHLPFPNLYNATTRRSAVQPELQEKTTQHFKLDLFEAMAAVTRGAAHSIFAEHRTGTIEVGKKADLAIAEMKWNAGDLLQAEVQETWQAGKCVFRKA